MITFLEYLNEIAVRKTSNRPYKAKKWVKRKRSLNTAAFRTARTTNKNAAIAKKNNRKLFRRLKRKR